MEVLGAADGANVGEPRTFVGDRDGVNVGPREGGKVGPRVGDIVVGPRVGAMLGDLVVGLNVVGFRVGTKVGAVGAALIVGTAEIVGSQVGVDATNDITCNEEGFAVGFVPRR